MATNTEEKARKTLEAKAIKLDLQFSDETSNEDLTNLIEEAEEKKAAEKVEQDIQKENDKKKAEFAKKNQIILKNTLGEDMDQSDYFFSKEAGKKTAPVYFNKISGYPVDREDLIEVFNRVFKPSQNFLFYKMRDRELYQIIVPLKHATTISRFNESEDGDFQRHAISFIGEGSVNLDALEQKLLKVANHKSIGEK